jgi:hypothetical protein
MSKTNEFVKSEGTARYLYPPNCRELLFSEPRFSVLGVLGNPEFGRHEKRAWEISQAPVFMCGY